MKTAASVEGKLQNASVKNVATRFVSGHTRLKQ